MTIALEELIKEYGVPGATVAYWRDGEIHEHAAGTLNQDTGVETTPDSLFQVGSVTKVWTTAQIMLLAEQGKLTLDTPAAEFVPEIGHGITIRHLVTHTSGLDGDFFHDTGRGDDCLEKYVTALSERPLTHPVGAAHSYSNGAFSVAGRIVEILTGKVWDTALREQLIEPLGLTHTWTLPEDVLRFRAATGHLDNGPTPTWGIVRSNSPAGQICATSADLVRFGRAFVAGGPLSADSVAQMAQPQIELPERSFGTHWGLGWILDTWDGEPVWSHGGNTIGQSAMLWVFPATGIVVAALANGGDTSAFFDAVLPAATGITGPERPTPPETPIEQDMSRHEGVYARTGSRITYRDGKLVYEPTDAFAEIDPTLELEAVVTGADSLLVRRDGDRRWTPAVFAAFPDGTPYLYLSGRATPKLP